MVRQFITRSLLLSSLLAVALCAGTSARAAGICDALKAEEEAAIEVSGTVFEVDVEGAMLELRDDCGTIPVMAPGETNADLEANLGACWTGAKARVTGVMFLGAVDADTVVCE